MAIGLFTVLAAVPWKQVIENAPQVAEGARKLWRGVAGKPGEAPTAAAGQAALADDARAGRVTAARMAAIEAHAEELHAQMLASSELINVLAEQNAQLVRRVEANRIRVLWLTAAVVIAVVIAIASLVVALGAAGPAA